MAGPVRAVSVTEARTHLSELVDQVRYERVPVELTKHGRPWARLVPPDGEPSPRRSSQQPPPDAPPWAGGLGFRLVMLAKAHRDFVAERLAGLGLYVGQELLLAQLWERDGITQSELVSRLRVEPPTVAKMLHRMAATDLVRRERDQADARVWRVLLTDRGSRLRPAVESIWREAESRLVAGLSADELSILRDLLQRAWPPSTSP